jgi:hypothetical protein
MKRKPHNAPESDIPPEVLAPEIRERARRILASEKPDPVLKCTVCGAEATPNSSEQLCWVCRRLKISAWRDVEQQMPAQE